MPLTDYSVSKHIFMNETQGKRKTENTDQKTITKYRFNYYFKHWGGGGVARKPMINSPVRLATVNDTSFPPLKF